MQVVEIVGKAGDMVAVWKTISNVQNIIDTTFTADIKIRNHNEDIEWWCIRVYASTVANIRQKQWDVLQKRMSLWGGGV